MSRTNKTAAVLNLIHGSVLSDDADIKKSSKKSADEEDKKHRVVKNPVVLEMESEFETEELDEDKLFGLNGSIVNAAYFLVNEKLGDVVARFKVCDCDKCLKEISDRVLEELPPMFVRMDGEDGRERLGRLIEEKRPEVLKALTKTVLAHKSRQHK